MLRQDVMDSTLFPLTYDVRENPYRKKKFQKIIVCFANGVGGTSRTKRRITLFRVPDVAAGRF